MGSEEPLKSRFNPLWHLESNKDASISERGSSLGDDWVWSWGWRREPRGREEGELNDLVSLLQGWRPKVNSADKPKWWLRIDGEFSMRGLKTLIEERIVTDEESVPETSWSKLLPKKIAILIWRVKLGRIPCRETLDRMGIDIHSTLCPRYSKEVETIDHAFFQCEEVSRMWRGVARWWNRDLGRVNSVENLLATCDETGESLHQSRLWKETVWAFVYLVWIHRNQIVFDAYQRKLDDLFFEFQRRSYEWIAYRIQRKKEHQLEFLAIKPGGIDSKHDPALRSYRVCSS